MTASQEQRLNDIIEALIETYPEGLTAPELAERLGVTRQTTHSDIQRLETRQIPVADSETKEHAYTQYLRRFRCR